MSYVQPKIINLSCVHPDMLTVQWELNGNSDGYKLSKFYLYETYPGISGESYQVSISPANINDSSGSFETRVLTSGLPKKYQIKAYYTFNNGAANLYSLGSNIKTFTVYGIPSKPIIRSINADFPRRMDIIWDSSNIGDLTLNYIDVSYSNALYSSQIENIGISNPLIINDISKGSYSVQIKTINTSGFGSHYSDVSNITIYDIPSRPSFVGISDISLNTINIIYSCNDEGGTPVISANCEFDYNSQTYNKSSLVSNSSFNVDLSNSPQDSIYGNNYTNIKFRLINKVGSSLFSDASAYIPNTIPSQVKYIKSEPFDGSYTNTSKDCSSIIFFSCNNNGAVIDDISGYFVNQNSEIISNRGFIVHDISYISEDESNIYNYKFSLSGIKIDETNYIKFNCKNKNGYSAIQVYTNLFFATPVIAPVYIQSIINITSTPTITFKTLKTTIINSYDIIKYSFRFNNNDVDDGSGTIVDLYDDEDNTQFSISDQRFNGKTIIFSFWLENRAFTSNKYSKEITVYMIPPTTPFISILPVGQNIQVSYYTNISTPIKNIIYDISGVYNKSGGEYNPIDEDLPFQFNIELPPIGERSATQSYSVRAKFINMFGESDWSEYAYINNDSITEYTTSQTNCRYISVTPANRFEVISPYDLGFTKEELDSRRKYEVLQYFGNSSTSNVKNNFTNKQRYALASRGSNLRGIGRAQGITTNNFSCVVEPSGFFNIPLYNYTVNKQYDKYEELPSPKQWYMNYVKNQEFSDNTENIMLSIYVNKFISSSSSQINIKNSIFIDLSGKVNYFGTKITYTITSCDVIAYNIKTGQPIRTYTIPPGPSHHTPIEGLNSFEFTPVEGSPRDFHVIYYCGDLDFTMGDLPTANGDVYNIKCKFNIISSDTNVNNPIINAPRIRVITAGRSVIL